jgi:F-type H+-transporting ATPase subunit b
VNVTVTLFGQMLTFGVLVWFVMQFLWEPMTKMLEDRKKRIADGLAAAERGRHELHLAESRAKERLVEAKQQVAEIIAQANKRSDEIVEEAKLKAQAEGRRQLEAAQAEIEQEANRARAHLREQFADAVIMAAEKILERELNAQTHAEFIEKMAEKI